MNEKEVLKKVIQQLKVKQELHGDIIWYSRLNSGKINVGKAWVQLCTPGTPDVVAVVNCYNGKIALLFIECKRTGVKRLRYEQQKFFESMEGKPMTMCVLINEPTQLNAAIRKARDL